MIKRNSITNADARTYLPQLEDQSVHCIVSSPPYYCQRDYKVSGQIGLEETPEEFISELTAVFSEAKRVLRDDGVCWLNIGDSYYNYRPGKGQAVPKRSIANSDQDLPTRNPRRANRIEGVQENSLLLIPQRLGLALQADGWIIRNVIIWHKPTPQPEGADDRLDTSHEIVYLLAKSNKPLFWLHSESGRATRQQPRPDYFWRDNITQAEYAAPPEGWKTELLPDSDRKRYSRINRWQGNRYLFDKQAIEHRGTVWTVKGTTYSGDHYAVFPPELIEPMILAGTPLLSCAQCGAGYTHFYTKEFIVATERAGGKLAPESRRADYPRGRNIYEQGDLVPTCDCNAEAVPGVVLDMFGGAGTVGLVAARLQRDYLLGELSEYYCTKAQQRIDQEDPFKSKVLNEEETQLSLFGKERS